MSTLEEFEQRKRELQLRSDIAGLERQARIRAALARAGSWNWRWVGSLALMGGAIVVGKLGQDEPISFLIGLAAMVPGVLKLLSKTEGKS